MSDHSAPQIFSYPTLIPKHLLCIFFFFKYSKTNLFCPNILACVVFYWSMVNLPGSIFLRKVSLPLIAANNHQQFHGLEWGCMFSSPSMLIFGLACV